MLLVLVLGCFVHCCDNTRLYKLSQQLLASEDHTCDRTPFKNCTKDLPKTEKLQTDGFICNRGCNSFTLYTDTTHTTVSCIALLVTYALCVLRAVQPQVQFNCLHQPPPVQTAGRSSFIYFSNGEQVRQHRGWRLSGSDIRRYGSWPRHKGTEKAKCSVFTLQFDEQTERALWPASCVCILMGQWDMWEKHVSLITTRDHKLKLRADFCTRTIKGPLPCLKFVF